MNKFLRIFLTTVLGFFFAACSTIPMATPEKDVQAKLFATKKEKANIYVYRNEILGAAVKLDLLLNGKPLAKTGPQTYVLAEVDPGQHTLVSRGENDDEYSFKVEANKNYFIWQEVKMGFMFARSKLQPVDEAKGKAAVHECKLIQTGSN